MQYARSMLQNSLRQVEGMQMVRKDAMYVTSTFSGTEIFVHVVVAGLD